MKPHLLLSLFLSIFAANAYATSAQEREQRLVENGPDRLVQQYQRV
ncbi:hypothetical protein V2K62_09265 [Pseudomonas alliivorans]|uniref:DUF2790 domain-containing protein n=1 Tax=Pseudomonas alliivorans TaxID=2810613 RepID=A0ABS4C945_9PSED|nr:MULTISPECIES: hypothetical protein [Pseudomonas]MBP0939463.1 hypothetical protein [Pseudomonas alliivorans]MBP0947168.1 hypothetical protein [Pseudomonas alliivorans]MBP0951272.1 hypothetical protein [Pseudomonas alliivorans]MCO5367274.1 hypothetical protein [Pseudomonas alliivorans]MEE4305588.1 hypothetical protein [Pseudomonas alliivorans]